MVQGDLAKLCQTRPQVRYIQCLKGVKAETEKQEKDGVQIARYFIVSKPH